MVCDLGVWVERMYGLGLWNLTHLLSRPLVMNLFFNIMGPSDVGMAMKTVVCW